jgi:hypothetical protein
MGFLNLLRNSEYHYDIIIFSNTIYSIISHDISNEQSDLYKVSQNYYPIIRKHYRETHYAHNVVYFDHSLSGFLYNPNIIPSLPQDTIEEMFKKSQGKYVVMIDDPIEADFLLNLASKEAKKSLSPFIESKFLGSLNSNFFSQLYRGTNFIITNTPERIVTKSNFSFAFQWSGDSLEMLRNAHGKLKLYIHPNFSYVSSDLLASLNKQPDTLCVAKKLSSQAFLTHEQAMTKYFSPYGGEKYIKDPYFKALYQTWITYLPTLAWINSVDEKTFNRLIKEWDKIKFEVSMQNHQ